MAETPETAPEAKEVAETKETTESTEAPESKDTPEVKEVPEAKDASESKESTKAKDASEAKESTEAKATEESSNESPEVSSLEQKIIRQVEYYFGDYNLPKDKFLQENIKKDDGWVTMETMLNFQRLKNISSDPLVICDALLKSATKLMEVSEDKLKIRRSPGKPLPELSDSRRQEIIARSVYVKGFPQTGVTFDTLLEFFAKFGQTDNVQMRNWHDKVENNWKFKGSVFVTFPTKDAAEAFLKLDSVKHEETELIRKWQADYLQEKKVEAKEGKRGKDKRKHDLLKAADGDAKGDENGADKNGDDAGKGDKPEPKHVYGAVLVLKGLSEATKWTDVKDKLVEMGGEVAFVDFSPGDPEAFARLTETGSAKTLYDKMEDGKIEIGGVQVEARILEGEEEQKYLDDQQQTRKNLRQNNKRRGGSMRGRGRGRGAKRGRF